MSYLNRINTVIKEQVRVHFDRRYRTRSLRVSHLQPYKYYLWLYHRSQLCNRLSIQAYTKDTFSGLHKYFIRFPSNKANLQTRSHRLRGSHCHHVLLRFTHLRKRDSLQHSASSSICSYHLCILVDHQHRLVLNLCYFMILCCRRLASRYARYRSSSYQVLDIIT